MKLLFRWRSIGTYWEALECGSRPDVLRRVLLSNKVKTTKVPEEWECKDRGKPGGRGKRCKQAENCASAEANITRLC